MELNIDPHSSHALWRVFADVEDGPVIQSIHDRDMKVTRVRFDYVPNLGVWETQCVVLMGKRINKDGNPGQRDDDLSYGYVDRAPEWVQKSAEHFKPQGPAPEAPIPLCVLCVEE